MVVPAGVSVEAAEIAPAAIVETAAPPNPAPAAPNPAPERARSMPSESCLATTICRIKDRVRWGTPAWSANFCRRIAKGVLASSKKYDVAPTLVLAVMMNESDLDEKAAGVSMKNGKLYAKDSGLMGLRCVLDKQGRCGNGFVRGISWKRLMDPLTNIDLGAKQLSQWRTAGVSRVTVRVRNKAGRIETKQKYVTCRHKTHAFWAHYNHGPVYIDRGPARHYPHRVAVLEYALAQALNVEAPELTQVERITIRDKGQRARTPDRPVEPRFRKLCSQIREVGGQCSSVAALAGGGKLN